jgi:hypothetical protein
VERRVIGAFSPEERSDLAALLTRLIEAIEAD